MRETVRAVETPVALEAVEAAAARFKEPPSVAGRGSAVSLLLGLDEGSADAEFEVLPAVAGREAAASSLLSLLRLEVPLAVDGRPAAVFVAEGTL